MRKIGSVGLVFLTLAACGGAPEAGQLFIDSRGGGAFDGSAGAGISEQEIRSFVQLDVCGAGETVVQFSSAVGETGVTTFSGSCG